MALLKNREEFANWLTRVVIRKFLFQCVNNNIAVGLEHKVLFADFNYYTYYRDGDMCHFARVGIFNSGLRMTDVGLSRLTLRSRTSIGDEKSLFA